MPKLRGHHLICLQFFVGKGYNQRFVENTFKVLRNAKRVIVVDGMDDVCKACPNKKCSVEELDRLALSLLSIKVGSVVRWDDVRRRLRRILPIWIRKACRGCRWWRICRNETLKFKCQLHGKHG